MGKTYSLDLLATESWRSYFINKVHNQLLRDLKNVEGVAIRLMGNIFDLSVQEYSERGGFVYELQDSYIKSTLDVSVHLKNDTVIHKVLPIRMVLKLDRKRSIDALGEAIEKEMKRFKTAFEQAGKKVYTLDGVALPSTEENVVKVFMGESGYQLFLATLENGDSTERTLEAILRDYASYSNSPANERGQRIVQRFKDKDILKALTPTKVSNLQGVPILEYKSKKMHLYLAPTFALLNLKDKISLLYNIDKGDSVTDAFLILQKLQHPKAEMIAQLMDLRRNI